MPSARSESKITKSSRSSDCNWFNFAGLSRDKANEIGSLADTSRSMAGLVWACAIMAAPTLRSVFPLEIRTDEPEISCTVHISASSHIAEPTMTSNVVDIEPSRPEKKDAVVVQWRLHVENQHAAPEKVQQCCANEILVPMVLRDGSDCFPQ